MQELIAKVWQEYEQHKGQPFVVNPSMPILFFGDSQRYQASDVRVITVALNPSLMEFPSPAPFERFPAAQDLYPKIMTGQGYDAYMEALDSYFYIQPYRAWFSSFEPILNGLGSSFYGAPWYAALHTDLCSPLATIPTWSRLPDTRRAALRANGIKLWRKLVEYLQPDIIIVSVARAYLSTIPFQTIQQYPPVHVVTHTKSGLPRAKDYRAEVWRVEVSPTNHPLLVFGEAANTPFGTVSTPDKLQIGMAVSQLHTGG